MQDVTIYTRAGCYYCDAARTLLTRKNVPFQEIDATGDREKRAEMIARSNGGMTFPQIFIGGRHVGGCDDLYELERAGRLDAMLAGTAPA